MNYESDLLDIFTGEFMRKCTFYFRVICETKGVF